MTEQQRKGIEILNDLKANRYDDGNTQTGAGGGGNNNPPTGELEG